MNPQIPESADAALRMNQLICIALLVGQFLFAVVIYIVHSTGAMTDTIPAIEGVDIFMPVGVLMGAVAIPAAFVLRKVIWRRGATGDPAAVVQSFLAGNLVFHAMIEGASLLNLTFWFITADAIPYLPVAGVLFLIGLTAIPRRNQAT